MITPGLYERLEALKDNITKDLELLKEFEDSLRYTDNPRHKVEYPQAIEKIQESLNHHRQEYAELQQQLTGELSAEEQEVKNQLQQLDVRAAEALQPYMKYRAQVEKFVYAGRGKISPDSRRDLDELRGQLGLLRDMTDAIEAQVQRTYEDYRTHVVEFVRGGHGRISPQNRNLLDELRDRLKLPAEVAQEIERELQDAYISERQRRQRRVFLTSCGVALGVLVIRLPGWLQPFELGFYDQMIRLRPSQPDNRLLIIEIDKQDIEAQDKRGEDRKNSSLSDFSLARLLKKLDDQYNPIVIGLDIYRPNPIKSDIAPDNFIKIGNDNLSVKDYLIAYHLRNKQNKLFTICKALYIDEEGNKSSFPPPPDITPPDTSKEKRQEQVQERVGFSDVVQDDDGIVRRHLLALDPDFISKQYLGKKNPCVVKNAFSFVIASHYLNVKEKIGYRLEILKESFGELKFSNGVNFSRLDSFTGGYQNEDNAGGYQVLLNYRSPQSIPKPLKLDDVLNDRVEVDKTLKNRIVLIGVTARDITNDYWKTPYSATSGKDMSGVMLQAQMVSQIISAVKRERPLIWVWPRAIEFLWFWFWSLTAGILTWFFRLPSHFILAMSLAVFTLYVSCFFAFWLMNGWLPFLPPALGFFATGIQAYFFLQRPLLDDKSRNLSSKS